jgi:Arc/MetJ-type ribon-helix-helix transcriptional regulator
MGDVPNVDEPWRSGVKVTELTNTDLVDSRNAPVTFSDSKREYRHDITALANSQNINKSAAADRAIRVELAAAIDNGRVPFSREDFNIAYMIPPKRWVREKLSTYDAKIPRSEEIDTEQRHINVTTTPTVKQMMEAAVEAESYESKSDIIKNGINRYLEHPLAVEVLFATESRREILHAFFNTDNDWLRKADIVNKKSVSSESARINIEKLQSLGVIQARDPEVNIVHYSLTDNQVVNLLNKSDIPIKKLNKIFGSSSRRDLVSFFS